MFELILLFSLAVFLTAYIFFIPGHSAPLQVIDDQLGRDSAASVEYEQGEGALVVNEFLLQLQTEIESTLFPRPTDSVLKRHYDALVAVELGNRLAQMPV